jgi:hypothetical protein
MYQDGVKREEREIDGDLYLIAYMNVSAALEMGDRIAKAIAPALAELKLEAGVDFSLVARLLSKADGKALVAILRDAVKFVEVQPQGAQGVAPLQASWENHFKGRLDSLVRFIRVFVEVQYGSFTKLLVGAGGA